MAFCSESDAKVQQLLQTAKTFVTLFSFFPKNKAAHNKI